MRVVPHPPSGASTGRQEVKSLSPVFYFTATYTDNLLARQTYANGTTLNFAYDNLDRLTSRWYNCSSYKPE